MDRRVFLRRLALTAGGLTVAGSAGWCVLRPPVDGADEGALPFAVWRDIRQAIRSSPDHLVRRADDLVASGEPEAIFAFVRDCVATLPGDTWRMAPDRGMRWGVAGTLRCGSGTPREKAELLASLYRRAGFDAEMLTGPVPMSNEAVQALLLRVPERSFAPTATSRHVASWRRRLGLPPATETAIASVDTEWGESRALADMILGQLPEHTRARRFDWRWRDTPVVKVTRGDETFHANLFAPDLAFGEAGIDVARLRVAPPADALPEVRVALSVAYSPAPARPVTLVEGTWPLEDLVGRQVVAQVVPALGLGSIVQASFEAARVVIPSLTVQALDLDAEAAQAMSVVGPLVTRDGAKVRIDSDGAVTIDHREVVPATTSTSPDEIATLEVEADASHAPLVVLDITARDAQGRPVERLDRLAFDIVDEGQSVGVMVRANRVAPRIEWLVDQSGSMPRAYLGEAMTALTDDLTTRVRESYPLAEVRLRPTNSDIWTWLGRAAATDANLIVFATDGHVTDRLTDAIRLAVAQGPPVVVVNVMNYRPANHWYRQTFAPMAELTGGTVVPVSHPEDIATALLSYLDTIVPKLPAYRLEYVVDAAPGERRVRVSTRSGQVSGEARYVIPDTPALAPDVCGVYLTVAIGRESVTRTIAGYDPAIHASQAPTHAMVTDAVGACFGQHVVSIESGPPTTAAWLDDFVTAKLAAERLHDAAGRGDVSAIEAALAQGVPTFPAELAIQTADVASRVTASTLTFETSPRVVLARATPVPSSGHLVHSVDVLPFTRYATAADDATEGFRQTLSATARIAVVEASLFDTSPLSLLGEVPLASLSEFFADREIDLLVRQALRSRGSAFFGQRHVLVPETGVPAALWSIDASTGSLAGTIADEFCGGRHREALNGGLGAFDRMVAIFERAPRGSSAWLTTLVGARLDAAMAHGAALERFYGVVGPAPGSRGRAGQADHVVAAMRHAACAVVGIQVPRLPDVEAEPAARFADMVEAIGSDGPTPCLTGLAANGRAT